MKRVLNYVWKYRVIVFIGVIAMMIGIGFDMLNPRFVKIMLDDVITGGKRELIKTVLIGLGIVTAMRAVCGYVKELSFDYMSAKVNKELKMDLFNHIQSLSFSYFDGMNTGELMSRMSEDLDNIWRAVGFATALMTENIIYFVTASIILITINWKLAVISLCVMPFIAYIALKLEKEIGKAYGEISDQGAILNTTAQENIAGVRLVKAFAREKHEILKFLKMNNTNYELTMKQAGIWAKYFPVIEFITNVASIAVITFGGMFVIKDKMTIGTLVAFNGYLWMLIWPMRNLGWITNVLSQANASAKKIDKIMNTMADIKDCDNPIHLDSVKESIKFENVNFKYNDEYILKDINLDVKVGSTVAIMGTTGSGKTSLISLIGRYYDACDGKILIDGHDVKTLCLNDLRSRMAVVAQDNFLFSDTIEENVRMGKYDVTFDEVKNACKNACADEFIDELEEGYNSVVGERGIGLSGGQKQRIAIARALVRNADIQIFDDSTSALDMETEFKLLKNLNEMDKKVVTFVIAHRISAVKNADEIIYLEDGKIVERGNHEELLKKQGKYYEIYCDQFKDFVDIEQEVI